MAPPFAVCAHTYWYAWLQVVVVGNPRNSLPLILGDGSSSSSADSGSRGNERSSNRAPAMWRAPPGLRADLADREYANVAAGRGSQMSEMAATRRGGD
jgi:hypothetical protein